MSALSALLLMGAIGSPLANAAGLTLEQTFSGNDFFNGFKFNASTIDPTNFGNAHYVNQSTAQSTTAPLAFVDGSGNVILKVDNTTNANGDLTFGRNTVMVISKSTININTLLVLDVNHIPFGCSVWPAFWTINADLATGPGADVGGEIDIIEAVNLQTTNSYSLHTTSGCTLATNASFPFSGKIVQTNCDGVDFDVTGNQGCVITEPQPNSVGQNFAGGVYAMYWSTAGIQIWFFSRTSIPSDLSSNSPDPSTWPTPSASYAASGCDPSKFFQPQNIIIDIDVCGAFAGNTEIFTQTCSGTCGDLVGTASNYNNAYWNISSIKTFTGASSGSPSAGPSTSVIIGGTLGGALVAVVLVFVVVCVWRRHRRRRLSRRGGANDRGAVFEWTDFNPFPQGPSPPAQVREKSMVSALATPELAGRGTPVSTAPSPGDGQQHEPEAAPSIADDEARLSQAHTQLDVGTVEGIINRFLRGEFVQTNREEPPPEYNAGRSTGEEGRMRDR